MKSCLQVYKAVTKLKIKNITDFLWTPQMKEMTGNEEVLLGDKAFPAELEKGYARRTFVSTGFIHSC